MADIKDAPETARRRQTSEIFADSEFEQQFKFQTPSTDGRFVAEAARAGHAVPVAALLKKLFPQQNQKMNQLTDILRSWSSVVGTCAKDSAPYDFAEGILYVASTSSLVRTQLFNMRGNIQRKLKKRWGLDMIDLRVTPGPPPVKPSVAHQGPRRSHPRVNVTEQDVDEKLQMMEREYNPVVNNADVIDASNNTKNAITVNADKSDFALISSEQELQVSPQGLPDLNPEAAHALAHLWAFFDKRFYAQ